MNYQEIIALEPRIAAIVNEAKPLTGREMWIRYGEIKSQVDPLVGWFCKEEKLQNGHAYDVVMEEIRHRMGI